MVQAETLRREWREALERLLHYSVRGKGEEYKVWEAKVARIERVAKYNKIRLNLHASDVRN